MHDKSDPLSALAASVRADAPLATAWPKNHGHPCQEAGRMHSTVSDDCLMPGKAAAWKHDERISLPGFQAS